MIKTVLGGFGEVTVYSTVFRILLAVLMGGLIGHERETKGRPAGFRTYILVCVGAALAMMTGLYLSGVMEGAEKHTDVMRIAAKVINGIGFLAAGTIIVTGQQQVKGMTTAAGLWTAACLGITIGAGFYPCALFGMFSLFVCMHFFTKLEVRWISRSKHMNILVYFHTLSDLGTISECLKSKQVKVYEYELVSTEEVKKVKAAVLYLQLPGGISHHTVLADLADLKCVRRVEEM